jgi:stalled ribosome rescue protein Dom34
MTYKIVKNFPQDLPLNAEGPFVSLYQTTQVFPLNKGNIITFKNLVKEATAQLEEIYGRREVEEFIKPLEEITNDLDFWVYSTQGIALFLNKDECLVFRLNQPVENQVFVEPRIHTRPAIAAFQNQIGAYLLALSKDNFKVYHCDFYSVEKVELDKSIETTLTAVLGDQKTDAFVGFGSTGTRNSTGLFYGQGGKKEEVDIDTEKFFRYVDKTVIDELSKKNPIPVILMSTGKNQTVFRNISNNPQVMSDGIALSPESLSEDEMCKHAREILQPEKQKRLKKLVDRASKALADQRAVDHIDEVASAAISGRIETLLIDYDKRYIADIDWQSLKIIRKDANHGYDLFEEIAQIVLKNRGQVFIIDSAMMPTTTGICAIYR